ncbi:hypothetical protein L332_02035 [Agrococcus pavilionensis RW1]|uniref:Uncharacterized protein n=1 Tax=Agrococcus pavilionensis RW1 TaxID=1330458 RepID=U1LMR3_9MICO|nr:hypothetical protein [Agrococcus pavilionensis]ERG63232.1 hypothetical protein L332_02035 [Agrococcus pavilionensis RW1]
MQHDAPTPEDPQQPRYGQQPQHGQSGQYGSPAPYGQPQQGQPYAEQPVSYAPYGQGGQHGQPASYGAGMPMPAVVKWGLGIQWAGVVLGVIGIGLALIGLLALAGAGEPGALGVVGALVAVAAVLVVAQVVVLLFATKGRNWARIVLAVLAAIGIVTSLASGQGLNFGSLISILSVVLLFLPAANEWFAARSAQR